MVTVGIRLPGFRLAAALRHILAPEATAFLIDRARRRVVDASDGAARAGVRPGMALREATRLVPRGAIVLEDPARAARAWRRVLGVLARLPAPVQDGGVGMAFVDVPRGDRPERWFERVRALMAPLGLAVRCGAGASRFVAALATHRAADAVCRPGCEPTFVADAPLELFGVDDDTLLRMHLLGARSFGQLAALPPAVRARFGDTALRLEQLARGDDAARAGVRASW